MKTYRMCYFIRMSNTSIESILLPPRRKHAWKKQCV